MDRLARPFSFFFSFLLKLTRIAHPLGLHALTLPTWKFLFLSASTLSNKGPPLKTPTKQALLLLLRKICAFERTAHRQLLPALMLRTLMNTFVLQIQTECAKSIENAVVEIAAVDSTVESFAVA